MGSLNFQNPAFYKQQSKHFINQISTNYIPQQYQIFGQQMIQNYALDTNRTKINSQGIFPLCSIGHLQIHHPNDQKFKLSGTCVIIDNYILLTCAHNLYNYQERLYYKTVDFYPNANGPLKKHKIRIDLAGNFKIHENFYKYKTKEHQNYDYGIIFLKQGLSQKYGTVKISNCKVDKNDEIFLFGYPISDNNHKDQMYLYGSKGKVTDLHQHTLYYDIQTQAGQSGSPIFIYKQKQWKLIGIHTISDPSGVLLNQESMQTINQWINIKESTLKIQDIKTLNKSSLKIQKMYEKDYNWQTLTYLSFIKCNLNSKDILKLNKLNWNIKQLNLNNNQIDNICLQPIKFNKLEILYLDNNLIYEIKKDINYFIALKKISLVNNKIKEICGVLENKNLQIILYGNKLTKIGDGNINKNYIF